MTQSGKPPIIDAEFSVAQEPMVWDSLLPRPVRWPARVFCYGMALIAIYGLVTSDDVTTRGGCLFVAVFWIGVLKFREHLARPVSVRELQRMLLKTGWRPSA